MLPISTAWKFTRFDNPTLDVIVLYNFNNDIKLEWLHLFIQSGSGSGKLFKLIEQSTMVKIILLKY